MFFVGVSKYKCFSNIFIRFEWKVKNQQDAARAALANHRSVASDIVEALDWLRAADIKMGAAPLLGHKVSSSSIDQSIKAHQVCFTLCF